MECCFRAHYPFADRANKGAWKAKAQLNLAQIDAGTGGVTLADAKSAFEFAVGDWSVDCTDVQLLLQLGQTYLDSVRQLWPSLLVRREAVACVQGDESLFKSAKEVFLRAAKVCDWAIAWLGAGQAAYLSGSLDQAEAALNQANIRYGQCSCCIRAPLRSLLLYDIVEITRMRMFGLGYRWCAWKLSRQGKRRACRLWIKRSYWSVHC